MKYTDMQRVEKMRVTTGKLLAYLSENAITREDILTQEPLRWAITTPLYNIGEHAYQLSEGFRAEHRAVPWSKIAGLRHRLVHDYDNTNWTLICTVLYDVLPGFLTQLEAIEEDAKQ
ncbi:MAG: DUF86 domain-containing protein [Clostridia bacterium]|nr:DUF86 domain-containing protein [Clostridia bacterium]